MKHIFLLSILISLSSRLFASPQMPDYIIFRGDTIATYNLLLEQYLQQRDTADSQLFGLSFRNAASFNCWRGYQALYEITNDSLFLTGIFSCGAIRSHTFDHDNSLNRMRSIFGDKVSNGKVYIDWFSGILNFPLNNKVLRWDGVFYTIFERETLVSIFYGHIKNIRDVKNYVNVRGGIDRRDKNKISDILFKKLEKVRWRPLEDCDCGGKYIVTINEYGKISKVKELDNSGLTAPDEGRERDSCCCNTIFKALQPLRFDIIKNKGRAISDEIYLHIWIKENGRLENWGR